MIPRDHHRIHACKSSKAHFLLGCVLCNDGTFSTDGDFGDPTEMALLHMAQKCGTDAETLRKRFERKDEKGFDSERKMMTTLHHIRTESGSRLIAYSKGAAEKVIEQCAFFYQNGQ